MKQLAASLADDDRATARRVAHTLKGTAATLGADRLAEMARHLEELVRASASAAGSRDEIDSAMEAVRVELTALAAALPPLAAPTDFVPTDPETLRKVLDELEALLAQSNAAAITLFEDNPALRGALGAEGEKLEHLVKQFDFGTAREALRALRQTSERRT